MEFTPAEFTDLPVGERQAVQVSISGITGYGDWVGDVVVSWSGKTAGEVVVPIEVHIATIPVLELESPDEVIVSGTRSQTEVDFQVTLHETGSGSPASGVVAFIQSLPNADQSAAFPSTGIEAVNLSDAISSATQIAFDLDWEGKRELKGRLWTDILGGVGIRYEAAFIEELGEIAEREEIPVTVKSTKFTIFNKVWWTAKRRLVAYYIITISVGVVLLTVVGLKTLYFNVPDFGANSFWDYLKVMLWGFGAEASSSEVSGLIKEWGIPLAGGKQS